MSTSEIMSLENTFLPDRLRQHGQVPQKSLRGLFADSWMLSTFRRLRARLRAPSTESGGGCSLTVRTVPMPRSRSDRCAPIGSHLQRRSLERSPWEDGLSPELGPGREQKVCYESHKLYVPRGRFGNSALADSDERF
jgi:hypothetical protein